MNDSIDAEIIDHRSTDVMPTRVQQLGLLILLTALAVYVVIRIGW